MDWTVIGIGVGLITAIFGVVWREILYLRKRVHDMDNTAQRIILQAGVIDNRMNEVKATLEKHSSRYEEMLEKMHETLLDLKLTQQLLGTIIRRGE